MAYLCVNKNGDELIFQDAPKRYSYHGKDYYNKDKGRFEFNPSDLDHWISGFSSNSDAYVDMPKGSIEKLTGQCLTWEDEPIEI